MSGEARHEHHEHNERGGEKLIENDWLWSCPIGMRTHDIANSLGFTAKRQVEFSARGWDDEVRFRDDMYRMLVPDVPLETLVPRLKWDALYDYLSELDSGVGVLIVIRDLPPEVPFVVEGLVEVMSDELERVRMDEGVSPGEWLALVLEGFSEPAIRGHLVPANIYAVNPIVRANG